LCLLFGLLPVLGVARTLPAQEPAPRPYAFEAAASRIYVLTHRSGLLSFLGHEHSILVNDWSGGICWAPEAPIGGRGLIRADVRTLTIDSDSGRALAGLGSGPSPERGQSLQQKMLDAAHLDADSFPEINLDSLTVVASEGERLTLTGVLSLHGVSRRVEVELVAAPVDAPMVPEGAAATPVAAAAYRLRGQLTISQRAFGIEPESIAGVVKVSDDVDIHFDLIATPAVGGCG